MNIVPAQEIKRRGIAAVDEALAQGPVHIIKNNRPQYVVLTEESYRELLEAQEEAAQARIKTSLEDARAHCRAFFRWYNTEHRHSEVV